MSCFELPQSKWQYFKRQGKEEMFIAKLQFGNLSRVVVLSRE